MMQALLKSAAIFFLLLSNSLAHCQGKTFQLVSKKTIPESIAVASMSRYGILHVVTEDGTLYQIDTLGQQKPPLTFREFNGASSLDAWRTLQVLVFSESLQQAYWLDRLMGSPQALLLPSEYYYTFMASASTNGVWAYESQELALHHIELANGTVDISIPLRATPVTQEPEPICTDILSRHDKVYACFENQGVAIGNNYGSYLQWIAHENAKHIAFSAKMLYIFTDETIFKYNAIGAHPLQEQLILPKGNWQAWHVHGQYFFGIEKNAVSVFKER